MKQSFNRPASGGTEEVKMFKFIHSIFAGSTAPVEPVSPAQPEEPTFLLPETAESYRQRREALVGQDAARREADAAEANQLDCEAAGLRAQAVEAESRDGNVAQKELNRREAEKLREEAERNTRKATSLRTEAPVRLQRELEEYLKKLPAVLRKEEAEILAHQGEIVKQTFDDTEAESILHDWGKEVTGRLARRSERRLVRYEGRVFLVHLTWSAVTRIKGYSKGGCYGGEYEEHLPTGEWKPPVADWATDSVSQMSNEELRAIA